MAISVTKPSVNLREKLNELDFDRVPFQKMPAGSVLQVVEGFTSTQVDVSVIGKTTIYDSIVSITPRCSTSKIVGWIQAPYYQWGTPDGQLYMDVEVTREHNSVVTEVGQQGYVGWEDIAGITIKRPMNFIAFTFADYTFNTTEQLNYGYRVDIRNLGGNSKLGFSYDDSGGHQESSILLMEIAQ